MQHIIINRIYDFNESDCFTSLVSNTIFDGTKCLIDFENGYGASIIRHKMSYGGDKGLYELAVLKGIDICCETEIASDVVGWLSREDVNEILLRIQNLK